MNSQEITVWLDERWVKAIEKHHGRIEDKVNEYLDELINSLPDREYEKISREINTERIREEEMREAAKKYTAFRITETETRLCSPMKVSATSSIQRQC